MSLKIASSRDESAYAICFTSLASWAFSVTTVRMSVVRRTDILPGILMIDYLLQICAAVGATQN